MSLPDGFELREVERFDEAEYQALVERNLSRGSGMMRPLLGLPPEEQARIRTRRAARNPRPFELRVGIWQGAELVAWTFAAEESRSALMMHTSGVEPAHRRLGLYTALLRHLVVRAHEEGYERVTSLHSASNQPILIAKLKEGFVVSGLQMNVEVGLVVRLELPLHALGRAAFDTRSGWLPPSPEILGLWSG